MQNIWRFISNQWFLIAMFGLILMASINPHIGKTGGLLQLDQLSSLGIALVFFLYGLGLSFEKLKQGIRSWKVHILVQVTTFLIFPLIFLIFYKVIGNRISDDLMLGFCFLCALPSTVSSSVALVGLARGNVPAAIFNATISGLIGIVATPFIIAVFYGLYGGDLSLAATIISIAKLLLLPLVVGQLARPLLLNLHQKYKFFTSSADRFVILMLVFSAFSDSVISGLWQKNGFAMIILVFVLVTVLLIGIVLATTLISRSLGLSTQDEIAAVFCGSVKTLASGVPMAKIIFGAHPGLGLIMLPIIFFHQAQLIICSILASRYAKRGI